MIALLIRNFYFMIGFLYILCLLGVSLGYHFIFNDVVREAPFVLNAKGEISHAVYFSPLEYPPFGTDFYGYSLFSQFIIGAKYTIGMTIIIAFFRLLVSTILGSVIGVFLPKIYRIILPLVNGYKYYPATLLCLFIVLYHSDHHILFIIFLLAGVAIPTTTITIAGEMREVLSKPFIESSYVLGASKRRILLTHVRPFLIPQLTLIFIRELVQTVLLIAHLAILGIFITNATKTYEWAGLLGDWWDEYWKSTPWQAFEALLWITTIILGFHAMAKGLEEALRSQSTKYKKRIVDNQQNGVQQFEIGDAEDDFQFIRKES